MDSFDILLAVFLILLILVLFGAFAGFWWYSKLVKKALMAQDDGKDNVRRSIELSERGVKLAEHSVQLQEETNNLLREILNKTR